MDMVATQTVFLKRQTDKYFLYSDDCVLSTIKIRGINLHLLIESSLDAMNSLVHNTSTFNISSLNLAMMTIQTFMHRFNGPKS